MHYFQRLQNSSILQVLGSLPEVGRWKCQCSNANLSREKLREPTCFPMLRFIAKPFLTNAMQTWHNTFSSMRFMRLDDLSIWFFLMITVGKYASPMDPMGCFLRFSIRKKLRNHWPQSLTKSMELFIRRSGWIAIVHPNLNQTFWKYIHLWNSLQLDDHLRITKSTVMLHMLVILPLASILWESHNWKIDGIFFRNPFLVPYRFLGCSSWST